MTVNTMVGNSNVSDKATGASMSSSWSGLSTSHTKWVFSTYFMAWRRHHCLEYSERGTDTSDTCLMFYSKTLLLVWIQHCWWVLPMPILGRCLPDLQFSPHLYSFYASRQRRNLPEFCQITPRKKLGQRLGICGDIGRLRCALYVWSNIFNKIGANSLHHIKCIESTHKVYAGIHHHLLTV